MDLAKPVVEGLETTPLRQKLDAVHVPYDKEKDRTIALLEKLLNVGSTSGELKRLTGLRTIQNLRSKAKGHAGGSEVEELAQEALMKHETFANHFKHVSKVVFEELELLEKLLA